MNEVIKSFWNCSINNDFSSFDFDDFFSDFLNKLKMKLSLHGKLTLDDYIYYLNEYYALGVLRDFIYKGKHSGADFSIEDIKKSIFTPRYEFFRDKYKNNNAYDKLLLLYRKLKNHKRYSTKNKILLVDECIHAEHNNGNIINVDITELRRVYENRICDLSIDKAFGILTRNGIDERIKTIKGLFNVIFIDFDNVHNLNKINGYNNINNLFKRIFGTFKFRRDDLVGRWFSGDEIIIVTKGNCKTILKRFNNHADAFGVKFKFAIFEKVISLEEIENNINKVIK